MHECSTWTPQMIYFKDPLYTSSMRHISNCEFWTRLHDTLVANANNISEFTGYKL